MSLRAEDGAAGFDELVALAQLEKSALIMLSAIHCRRAATGYSLGFQPQLGGRNDNQGRKMEVAAGWNIKWMEGDGNG